MFILEESMKRRILILSIFVVIVFATMLHSEPYTHINYPHEELGSMWFDSLNIRFIGDWPFGPSYAIACDSARNIAFCGSGGVYTL